MTYMLLNCALKLVEEIILHVSIVYGKSEEVYAMPVTKAVQVDAKHLLQIWTNPV